MKLRTTLAIAASLFASGPALADSAFILPSITNISGTLSTITFDAAGSDHLFYIDHRPLQLSTIKAWKPDGTPAELSNALTQRLRTVFDLRIDQEGTWKVVSTQTMVTGTFEQNGEVRRVGPGRPPAPPAAPGAQPAAGAEPPRPGPVALQDVPADAANLHLTEAQRSTATFVTSGAPTDTVLKPSGQGLEFAPVTHPNALVAGETAQFRYLIDGKPAAGVKVIAVPDGDRYRDELDAMKFTTNAQGIVTIKWPHAGLYWVGAEAEDAKPTEKRAEKREMSYAVTLEVMTP